MPPNYDDGFQRLVEKFIDSLSNEIKVLAENVKENRQNIMRLLETQAELKIKCGIWGTVGAAAVVIANWMIVGLPK